MRHRRWLPAVLVAALLLPARDADAIWEFIRELSGPGPWYGGDLRYSISLSSAPPPALTRELNNENVDTLKMIGVKTEFLAGDVEEFVAKPGHQRLMKDEFGVSLPDPKDCPLLKDRVPADAKVNAALLFLCAIQSDSSKLNERLPAGQKEKLKSLPPPGDWERARDEDNVATAATYFEVLQETQLSDKTQELRKLIRHYDSGGLGGIGGVGLFGSFRSIPDLKDRGRDVKINNNWFFSPSLGFAFSLENNIPYADGIVASKHVLWLSLYLPLEKRFKAFGCCGTLNWFTQIGLAGHLFLGDRFKGFWKGSARGRMGLQMGQGYVAFQLDYFVPGIRNEQFGGLPDPDAEHFGVGFVFGINVN